MITGARRGELVTLRWRDLDLDTSTLAIRRSYVDGVEKDTKTHQIRRLALDQTTVELLSTHGERYEARIRALGGEPDDQAFVFSYEPDHARRCDPDGVATPRCAPPWASTPTYTRCGITRPPSFTSGVDVRTVTGRLGHGGGGTTTLRVYAAWNAESDKRAADILAARMTPPTRRTDTDRDSTVASEPPEGTVKS